ncbi:mitochondrial ATP-dependent zinc metallopeptidase [Trypanosoma cruzi marinkellei]|uniref:Mitochondrial ATP-dependent zinc metallopeptidase n=1 Tax=Trypanosoma cruzi marinkellei TaxID=85056 RepID=K2MZQ6_TRYCR|nr:mitochondrial ATP-dependent zinc metallopeptidase [Trypanosoma cruzi marinkellei]
MPPRKSSGSACAKKNAGECASQSPTAPANLPLANSVLRELLMDLGLTETAKTLEEESRRRLQFLPSATVEHSNFYGNGPQTLDVADKEEKSARGNAKEAKTTLEPKGKDGNGTPSYVSCKIEGRTETQLPSSKPDTARTAFLWNFMHRKTGDDDETTNVGALQELCRIGIALPGWDAARATTTDDGDNNNSTPELVALTPHLRKLFNVFLDADICETEHGENKSGAQSADILPPEWVSLLELFFSYVEVLWAQICLVEAVSWADFTSQGWFRHRKNILERLSLLHEKLQRLLLDAHQLEINRSLFESFTSSWDETQEADGLFSSEGIKKDPSLLYSSANEVMITTKDIHNGIIAMFCRGASTFRKNIEEVSTWIIHHCGQYTKRLESLDVSETKLKEPISYTESGDASSSEVKTEMEGSSACRPWHMLMGVVRRAVLMGSGEVSDATFDADEPSFMSNPALRWAQIFLRIQILAWVVGSLAEFADVCLRHSQRFMEKTNCKAEGGHDTRRRLPIVSASLGFWYQNCAAQISEIIDGTKGIRKDSPSYPDNGQGKSPSQRLPRSRRAKMADENENIGFTLVNALKRAVHEYLAGTTTLMAPLRLSLLGHEWQSGTGAKLSNHKEVSGTPHLRDIINNEIDIHMALLHVLATGQPYQLGQAPKPRRTPLYFLLKKVLRAPKILLDLQNERVSVDIQLRSMENPAANMLLMNSQRNGAASKFFLNGNHGRLTQGENAMNEPVTVRTYEGEISVSGEATSGFLESQQILSGGTGIGAVLPGVSEESVEPFMFPTLSLPIHFQALVHRMAHQANEFTQSEGSASIGSDEDAVSSTEYNLDRPSDVVLNEVQMVSVTPCGSLLALLTTKGRLVVFALRAANGLNQTNFNDQLQDAFCEQLVLDVVLMKGLKDPYWYEQLESFLSFSPSGQFLLCSVQNAPPFVPEGDEASRSHHATTGKVFLYSLHRTECGQIDASDVASHSAVGEEDRLYAAFRIHKTLITVARWLDPRFWRGNSSSSILPLEEGSPLWKHEAQRRLAALQCLSSGRDNLILRWSPADGSIIQSIATFPVFDILVSPLMQAFYTINQYGQLSMYDAWNERDIESAKDNVVVVSQRGLPAALAAMQSSTDPRERSFTQKSAAPVKDGEMQDDFFVGTRIIGFDRRSLARGGTERESAVSRMSRLVQEKGLPAGTETKEGNRLGRSIVQQLLRQDGDHLVPHTLAVIEPSSGSDKDIDDDDVVDDDDDDYNHDGQATRAHRNHQGNTNNGSVGDGFNSMPFLRARHFRGEGKKLSTLSNEKRGNNDASVSGEAVLYRTGSRLVFDEISQVLCQSACIWPGTQEPRYAPQQQPYQLLSMAASGHPLWSEEDDETSSTCNEFIVNETRRKSASSLPTFSYYSDTPKRRSNSDQNHQQQSNNHSSGYHSNIGISSQRLGTMGRSFNGMNNSRRSKRNFVLPPVAENGRYLCITASVGPARALVPYDRPLEYRAGMYACLVFDVLYGSVVRVIPVCPILPRTALTENGVSHFHSYTKRAPIYILPCAVTVVRHPHRHQSDGVSSSTSVSRRTNCNTMEGMSGLSYPLCFQEEKEGREEEEMMNEDKSGHDISNRNSDNNGDSMVLVAVGALHSTTYVFDALTGSRVKVIGLRKQAGLKNALNSAQTRIPIKRARCSYVSLADLGVFGNCQSHRDDGNDDDDLGNRNDDESSTTSSELTSPFGDEQYGYQRQLLLNHLVEQHGMDTLLRAATELLRVVPLPFPPFCETLQEDCIPRLSEANRSNGFSRQQAHGHCGAPDATASFSSFPSSLQYLTLMMSCPSFLGQLQMALGGVSVSNGIQSVASRSDGEGTANTATLFYDVPFAHVAQRELCQALLSNETPMSVGENGLPSTGGVAPAVAANTSMKSASKPHKRFLCGVVNSVALFYDHVKGGVFVFSSDEYGGLFMAGGLIPSRV